MISKLIVVLVLVGAVLCQDDQQQQDASPEALAKLMGQFNAVVAKAHVDPKGNAYLGVLGQMKQHPKFDQAMNIIASNPDNNEEKAKQVAKQVLALMPEASNEEGFTLGQLLLEVMVYMQQRAAASQ